MLNINDALNNVIALVVVILILSLVVQSVQSVFKKLFKIKSRQIEESLVDLFTNVLNKPGFQPTNWLDKLIDHSPMWRIVVFWRPTAAQQSDVEEIYEGVVAGFKDIGRLAQSGKQMLDSIAKEDLIKILEKVPIRSVLPSFVNGVAPAFGEIKNLETAIKSIRETTQTGDARETFKSISANFQSMEILLGPLFLDAQSVEAAGRITTPDVAAGQSSQAGTPGARLLVRDVMVLRNINIDEVIRLLDEMEKAVAIAQNGVAANSITGEALLKLASGLRNITDSIEGLRYRLGSAVNAFEAKSVELGKWYDIVMQSFEERYNRSMKSWAVVTAFLVVMVLNANLFNVYRDIATSDVTRDLLVEKGGDVLKLSRERTAGERTAETQPASQPAAQQVTQPAAQDTTQQAKDLANAIQLVKSDASLYGGIGFAPLKWQQVKDWIGSLIPDKNTEQPWGLWWQSRKNDATGLLGWLLMAVLLSIGAPFWQDMLESLFGVKTLLRKKGDIKNVEIESGTGQPKT